MRLFEFEDLNWFPNVIRSGMLDYLRYLVRLIDVYQPVIPLLEEVLRETNETQIIDLCSGGGGSTDLLIHRLNLHFRQKIGITLTDKFPNLPAWKHLQQKTNGQIDFYKNPVDAENVPVDLSGIYTIFSAVHHFPPEKLKLIIKEAIKRKTAICLFDGGDKNLLLLLISIVFHPLVFFFYTPFFRPFKLSRIIFTYLIPLIPLCTIWDGCVSLLRLYRPETLLQLASSVSNQNYYLKAGRVKNKFGFHVTYLIGYPKSNP